MLSRRLAAAAVSRHSFGISRVHQVAHQAAATMHRPTTTVGPPSSALDGRPPAFTNNQNDQNDMCRSGCDCPARTRPSPLRCGHCECYMPVTAASLLPMSLSIWNMILYGPGIATEAADLNPLL
mmetsp:Transcript_29011/g.69058  ORF Transcript_29011/g.69058 Transcript_29011/m.69058 type:complete len:124 (+) Transcript_29011:101-472(+)